MSVQHLTRTKKYTKDLPELRIIIDPGRRSLHKHDGTYDT